MTFLGPPGPPIGQDTQEYAWFMENRGELLPKRGWRAYNGGCPESLLDGHEGPINSYLIGPSPFFTWPAAWPVPKR